MLVDSLVIGHSVFILSRAQLFRKNLLGIVQENAKTGSYSVAQIVHSCSIDPSSPAQIGKRRQIQLLRSWNRSEAVLLEIGVKMAETYVCNLACAFSSSFFLFFLISGEKDQMVIALV
ncbi:hypothetical protein Droror1_Dr00003703 [Drosera rotundifolia]